MPQIEITAEQAAALARGENVTLAPPAKRTFIIVADNGLVWEVKSSQPPKIGGFYGARCLRSSSRAIMPGDRVPALIYNNGVCLEVNE